VTTVAGLVKNAYKKFLTLPFSGNPSVVFLRNFRQSSNTILF